MVGEALMRISNTMEAERLTKSLDYQEKLRSRSNIRMIIGIICMFVAFMMICLGGMLLFILLKFQDPILDVWVPLVKAILNGMNASLQATFASSTYAPIQKAISIQGQIGLLNLLKTLNNLDLNGLLASIGSALAGAGSSMSNIGAQIANAISGVTGSVNDLAGEIASGEIVANTLNSMGIDGDAVAGIINNVSDITNSIAGVVDTGTAAAETASAPATSVLDLLAGLSNSTSGTASADLLSSGISVINKLANALSGLVGIFG